MKFTFSICLTAVVAFSASAVKAQHSDVLVTNVGGEITIGAANDIGGPGESFDLDTKVFESIMIPGFVPPTPADYEGTEPGFFALNGVGDAAKLGSLGATALPGNTSASLSLSTFNVDGNSSDLFYWDGTGAVDFDPAPAGTSFAFDPASGFVTSGPNGDFDDHPIYQLDATSGVPADGVYFIAPQISMAGLSISDPFYLVLLVDSLIVTEDDLEDVEHALEDLEEGLTTDAVVDFGGGNIKDFAFYEEAVDFVEENYTIPEPNTLLLGFTATCMIAGLRRK